MEILNYGEHMNCVHFDQSAKPQIELVKMVKGVKHHFELNQNEIIFFLEGRVRLQSRGYPDYEATKGKILFLPAGGKYTYETLSEGVLLIFRLFKAVQLCDSFQLERLIGIKEKVSAHPSDPLNRNLSFLEIKPVIRSFLERLIETLNHGVRCRSFFDLKIKEFFMMVRWYYPKEEIYDFLYFIISGDTAFSEYVRLRWIYYRNVLELAESMHMTPKQFSKKFGEVFSTTPYRWMKEGKARIAHKEITTTDEPFKHIADKYGYHSVQQFNKFIKAAFGKTPGEIRRNARKEREN